MSIFAILGELGFSFFRDFGESLSPLGGARGAAAMDDVLEGYAMAQVIALAILADGEVTDEERGMLERVAAEELDDPGEAARIIGQLHFQSLPTGDREELARAIAIAARPLDAADRRRTYELVAALAHGGTGLVGDSGYRTYRPTDPEGLLEAVARGLEVTVRPRP